MQLTTISVNAPNSSDTAMHFSVVENRRVATTILAIAKRDAAVIVGVATSKDYRCKGLATECLQVLCSRFLKEGKDLYLQYDNLEAGKIYERLGFRNVDQVIHYRKKKFLL